MVDWYTIQKLRNNKDRLEEMSKSNIEKEVEISEMLFFPVGKKIELDVVITDSRLAQIMFNTLFDKELSLPGMKIESIGIGKRKLDKIKEQINWLEDQISNLEKEI